MHGTQHYHPTSFFLSVYKNSCVTDSPPLPLLLWPLILKSSWIASREGKYSLHLPPELCVPLTLEQSLSTKNRLPTPNFLCILTFCSPRWVTCTVPVPLPMVTGPQCVTRILGRSWNDQTFLKKWLEEKLFICRVIEKKKNPQNYRIMETRNGKLMRSPSTFFAVSGCFPMTLTGLKAPNETSAANIWEHYSWPKISPSISNI